MADPAGRFHIVFNGEIYNFPEVRTELSGKGFVFRTDSDTEVLLAAYAAWGADCLQRLNGMFAFAVWDEQERVLFLARDRFGKKPLFTARTPTGFAFASEMKALFPLLPELRPHPELTTSSRRIMSYESSPDCLVLGIERFPAGHWGMLRHGELRLARWWNLLDHLTPTPQRYEEQVELVRETFLDACRIRMRSDVNLGTSLSGGIDSSSVLAGVAEVARRGGVERAAPDWQRAFTASFPGSAVDEADLARLTADRLGARLVVISPDPAASAGDVLRRLWFFEEMHLSPPFPYMDVYSRLRRDGVVVSLDGHGADELFGGYMRDVRVALRDAGLHPLQAWSVAAAYARGFPDSPQYPRPGRMHLLLEGLRLRLGNTRGQAGVTARDMGHPAWEGLDHLTRALYVATHETLLPTLLRNYDRYSMASGVEVRMPFLDWRLAVLAFSLPWSCKVRGGWSKAVLRDMAAPWLPGEIVRRRIKIGFNPPLVDWMRGPLREFFQDTVFSEDFAQCPMVDVSLARERLHAVLDSPSATYGMAEAAWTAMLPYLWERAVLKGEGAPLQ